MFANSAIDVFGALRVNNAFLENFILALYVFLNFSLLNEAGIRSLSRIGILQYMIILIIFLKKT